MGCCGGHHSNNDNHSHNVSLKTTIWTWLIGIGGVAGLIYLFN